MSSTATMLTSRVRRMPVRERPPAPPRRPPATRSQAPELVSGEQLLEAMNSALAANPECAGMRLGARSLEAVTGMRGCNWSDSDLVVRVHGTVGPRAFEALRRVVADARARYDVTG
jgi:hypothetical protein